MPVESRAAHGPALRTLRTYSRAYLASSGIIQRRQTRQVAGFTLSRAILPFVAFFLPFVASEHSPIDYRIR